MQTIYNHNRFNTNSMAVNPQTLCSLYQTSGYAVGFGSSLASFLLSNFQALVKKYKWPLNDSL